MSLRIQDPSFEESFLLHETLLNEFDRADYGAATFAFASRDGVNLLMEDASFSAFMEEGHFHLVVGIDAVTDNAALDELKRYSDLFGEHLKVSVFLHNDAGSLFHPKFSWFASAEKGSLVIGSGNLTQGGLRNNREAYACISLSEQERIGVEDTWQKWLDTNKENLLDIDNETVREVAEANSKQRHSIRKRAKPVISSNVYRATTTSDDKQADDYDDTLDLSLEDESVTYWLIDYESDMLIAEIPRAGGRWKQANFDKDSFENYFGATCNENGSYRVLFRCVRSDSSLGAIEQRQSVSVRSRNYRFELDGASGLDYPEEGRPIALFAKTATRAFLYELFMPDDPHYQEIADALDELEAAGAKMRRVPCKAGDLYVDTKDLPLWGQLL